MKGRISPGTGALVVLSLDILLCTRSSVITSVDMLSLTLLGSWMSSWTKTDLNKLAKASPDSLLVLVTVSSACLTLCYRKVTHAH